MIVSIGMGFWRIYIRGRDEESGTDERKDDD